MIHTFSMIIVSPKSIDYSRFLELVDTKDIKYKRQEKSIIECYENTGLKPEGITVEYKVYKDKKDPTIIRRHLWILVNLSKLMNIENPNVNLIPNIKYEKIESKLEEKLRILGLPKLNRWIPNRIDYSINLLVSDKQLYLKLIKKANTLIYSNKNKIYKTSVHYRAGSYALNLYDKEAELKGKKKISDGSENILRFEMELFNQKLNSLKGENEKTLSYYFDEQLIIKILLDYCQQAFYTSDHFVISKAIEIIDNSKMRKNKERALELLREINKQHSNIKKVLNKSSDIKKDKRILRDIDKKYGVNPVCLSYKDTTGSVKNGIKSLFHLIEQTVEL